MLIDPHKAVESGAVCLFFGPQEGKNVEQQNNEHIDISYAIIKKCHPPSAIDHGKASSSPCSTAGISTTWCGQPVLELLVAADTEKWSLDRYGRNELGAR